MGSVRQAAPEARFAHRDTGTVECGSRHEQEVTERMDLGNMLRTHVRARLRVTAGASLFLLTLLKVSLVSGAELLADGFESGVLTAGPARTGSWAEIVNSNAQVQTQASMNAARVGSFGMRVSDTDATQRTANGSGARSNSVRSITGRVFIRTWMRLHQAPPTGGLVLVAGYSPVQGKSIGDIAIDAAPHLRVQGSSAALNSYTNVEFADPIPLNQWMLLELEIEGMGSAQGTRRLRVDADAVVEETGIDFTGFDLRGILVGEAWQDATTFTGTIDFDEVRVTDAPPASRLALTEDAPAAGGCAPVTLALQTSTGAPAEAPYEVAVSLIASTAFELFADAACTGTQVAQITLPAGALGQSFSVRWTDGSTLQLGARHPDFIGANLEIPSVSAPDAGEGPTDAGSDAGEVQTDAGSDAGEGPPDIGSDAGRATPWSLTVGCTFSDAQLPPAALLMIVLMVWRASCSPRRARRDAARVVRIPDDR